MSTRVYYTDQELPGIPFEWLDGTGAIINFSSGWTFTTKLARGGVVIATQTAQLTGAATSPNITLAKWDSALLTSIAADIVAPIDHRDYQLLLYARRTADTADDVLKPGAPPIIRFVTAAA
jgi:hypothetical protein